MRVQYRRSLRVLTDEQIDQIHRASLAVLQETGVHLPSERVLSMVQAVGGKVDWSRQVVTFSDDVVEQHLAAVPSIPIEEKTSGEFRELGDTVVMGFTGGKVTMAWDVEQRKTRPATREDLRRATLVANALDSLRSYSPVFTPSDVPEGTNDIHSWAIAFLHSAKPTRGGYILRPTSVRPLLDLAVAYAGSEEEVHRRGLFRYDCFLSSPLRFAPDALEIALLVHDLGYPVHCGLPMVVAGATAPQSFAGALTLSNAECLAGIVISRAFGTDTGYGGAPIMMDPRTAIGCYGDPRRLLMVAASVELARHYRISGARHFGFTDASTPGGQAGTERTFGTLLNLMIAGPPVALWVGTLGPSGLASSLEQMVIDDEMCAMMNAFFRGIEVDDDHIALDLIQSVGIGGSYLAEEHTARYLREELWIPKLFSREPANQGGDMLLDRAHARVNEILSQPQPEPLSPEQRRDIHTTVVRAERAAVC